MGGTIGAKSAPGMGSTFHFTATFGVIKEEEPDPVKHHLKKLEGKTALIVDHNYTNRKVLSRMLTFWGMVPTEVETGEAALELLAKNNQRFEYILLDAQMPDMAGVRVAKYIKQNPSNPEITVIMMLTSTVQRGIFEQHRDLSISVYLNKPVYQAELFSAFLRHFRGENIENHLPNYPRNQIPHSTPTILPRNNGSTLKVLLVEDNVVNQRLAIRVLQKLGFEVTVADNGLQAVHVVTVNLGKFDLILMDVQMPEMGGFEATSRIREIEANTDIRTPIIAMTAHAIQGYREKCLAGGMDGYISKPIHIETVRRTIEETLLKSHHEPHEHVEHHDSEESGASSETATASATAAAGDTSKLPLSLALSSSSSASSSTISRELSSNPIVITSTAVTTAVSTVSSSFTPPLLASAASDVQSPLPSLVVARPRALPEKDGTAIPFILPSEEVEKILTLPNKSVAKPIPLTSSCETPAAAISIPPVSTSSASSIFISSSTSEIPRSTLPYPWQVHNTNHLDTISSTLGTPLTTTPLTTTPLTSSPLTSPVTKPIPSISDTDPDPGQPSTKRRKMER